jgi:hypothetical protein
MARARYRAQVAEPNGVQGTSDIDKALVEAVIRIALEVEARVIKLGPVITAKDIAP